MDASEKYRSEIVREFVLELDEQGGSSVYRTTHRIRLTVHPNYPDTDPNKWTVEIEGGALGFNWSSGEAKARTHFAEEVQKLRAKERNAKAEGRFAEGRFTIGSAGDDAQQKI